MSDYIVKIIPADPYFRPTETSIEKAKSCIEEHIKCASVTALVSEHPVFADCGSNLESISCPYCYGSIGFDWWGGAMNSAYENKFENLSVVTPCCGKITSLNDLDYYFKCGFACFVIELLDPLTEPDALFIEALREILGTEIDVINAHY